MNTPTNAQNSKFRNSNGVRLLRGLFWELTEGDKSSCLYTTKDNDYLGYISLKRVYLEMADPTEYRFANEYLENYEHWEMLTNCSFFKPYVDQWRKELELKLKSEALLRVMEDARDENSKTKFTANKFILEKGWEPNTGTKRGRPTKNEIKQAAMEQLSERDRLNEDFERLQIRVN